MSRLKRLFNQTPMLSSDFYLRPLKMSDADALLEIYSDEEVLKYQARKTLDEDGINHYLESVISGYESKWFVRWAVCLPDTDRLIGLVSIHHLDHTNNNVKIGYILNQNYWRKGIMTKVLSDVLTYLRQDIKLQRIEAEIHPDNKPSIKLVQKFNFKHEGTRVKCAFNPVIKAYEDRLIMAWVES